MARTISRGAILVLDEHIGARHPYEQKSRTRWSGFAQPHLAGDRASAVHDARRRIIVLDQGRIAPSVEPTPSFSTGGLYARCGQAARSQSAGELARIADRTSAEPRRRCRRRAVTPAAAE